MIQCLSCVDTTKTGRPRLYVGQTGGSGVCYRCSGSHGWGRPGVDLDRCRVPVIPSTEVERLVLEEVDRHITSPETTLAALRAKLNERSSETTSLADQLHALERKERQRLQLRHALRSGHLTADEAGDDLTASLRELEALRDRRRQLASSNDAARREEARIASVASTLDLLRVDWARARASNDREALRKVMFELISHVEARPGADGRPELTVVFVFEPAQASTTEPLLFQSNQSK